MKSTLYSKAVLLCGKLTRKVSDYGCPLFDKLYQSYVKKKIRTDYADIILKYKSIKYELVPQNDIYPIWIFWWQALEKMPEVVRICYNSILENAGEHPVHLITKENYRQYISELPKLDDILEHLRCGSLIYAHFSDIVRCYLLYVYELG